MQEQSSWLNQVAGYHRGYAIGTHEVEFTAEETGMGLTWLSKKLGRAIAVPNMTSAGLTFIGGRLFFVNGAPASQLAYHDEKGKLVGFCLMPNPNGDEKEPTRSRNGDDLHLVDWHDQGYRYSIDGKSLAKTASHDSCTDQSGNDPRRLSSIAPIA